MQELVPPYAEGTHPKQVWMDTFKIAIFKVYTMSTRSMEWGHANNTLNLRIRGALDLNTHAQRGPEDGT